MQLSLFGGTFLRLDDDGTPLPLDDDERFGTAAKSPWVAKASGFDVHAGVTVRQGDREGLGRLLRYCARPPFALERISLLPDGRVAYLLRKPRNNGATHRVADPNDERVRAEKGAKKVLLRNVIETKFDLVMRPIAERVLASAQLPLLSADAFFNETLFHELSHSLGPAFTQKDGKKVEVRAALESSHSAIEEAKADVMGAYNILFMIKRGEFPKDFRDKLLVSYFAGLFRSTRFGVAEAHGKGSAMQINRFLEEGAASSTPAGRFTVDLAKLEASIGRLVHDICMLQHAGDKKAADALLDEYGVTSEPMAKALSKLEGIPVDLRPIYPLAGE